MYSVASSSIVHRPQVESYECEYHLRCPGCQATYQVEEAKRLIEQPSSLNPQFSRSA